MLLGLIAVLLALTSLLAWVFQKIRKYYGSEQLISLHIRKLCPYITTRLNGCAAVLDEVIQPRGCSRRTFVHLKKIENGHTCAILYFFKAHPQKFNCETFAPEISSGVLRYQGASGKITIQKKQSLRSYWKNLSRVFIIESTMFLDVLRQSTCYLISRYNLWTNCRGNLAKLTPHANHK